MVSAAASKSLVPLTVIILTLNEERNLPYSLRSVVGWAREVIVLDSGSTDRTVEIGAELGARVEHHPFEGYASQRNFALDLDLETEWVLFLDADEILTPALKDEIEIVLAGNPGENGFWINRRFIWMGRWVRRGYYPSWVLRLLRLGAARYEDRQVNEQVHLAGRAGFLQHDMLHEDRNGVLRWMEKHIRYAEQEARELMRENHDGEIPGRLLGTPAERKRWLRHEVWERLPPVARPAMLFSYRFFLRGGFLDGLPGFTYHLLHDGFYRLLIDLRFIELRRAARGTEATE